MEFNITNRFNGLNENLKTLKNNNLKYSLLLFSLLTFLYSCNEQPISVEGNQPQLVYDSLGLVDSAVVYGCYPQLKRFFTDTLNITNFSKVKVEFDGFANSNGSFIEVLYNTAVSSNSRVYYVEDIININKLHSKEFPKPDNFIWLEIRTYINPPVCGQGEFKYTRTRDLKVYGIR